jgi:hypothetical protein
LPLRGKWTGFGQPTPCAWMGQAEPTGPSGPPALPCGSGRSVAGNLDTTLFMRPNAVSEAVSATGWTDVGPENVRVCRCIRRSRGSHDAECGMPAPLGEAMGLLEALQQGREAYRRRSWARACELLSLADKEMPLRSEDLELLATAAYLVGRDADSAEIWTRAHREFLSRGDAERAAVAPSGWLSDCCTGAKWRGVAVGSPGPAVSWTRAGATV